jgi:hypothetical protein
MTVDSRESCSSESLLLLFSLLVAFSPPICTDVDSCSAIDVPAIFIGVAAPEFVKHLDASRTALLAAASQETGSAHDSDLLDLYRGIIELQKMHNTFCPE